MNTLTRITTAFIAIGFVVTQTGCGTMVGIPAHGGGKRFATEQRLVSASIRSALKDIDVTPLRGKRVAVVFDLVADEGAGTVSGGRANILGALASGYLMSPVTTTTGAFQVFNLAESGEDYRNTSSGGSSVASTTYVGNSTGTSSGSNTSTSTGNNTNTTTGQNSNTGSNTFSQTSNGSGSNSSTMAGSSTGTTTDTSGSTTVNGTSTSNYNQTSNGTGSSTDTTTGSGTNASNGTFSQTSTGSGSEAVNSSGSNTDSRTDTGGNNQASSGSESGRATGGFNATRQVVTQTPKTATTQTKGNDKRANLTLEYKGLGDYTNFAVPKSDASLLMGLVRNYLLLNEIIATTPDDQSAEYLMYVTVDIFGTVRSRFDSYIYNQETLRAETSFEMMAFDRTGRLVLSPRSANSEAKYAERYLFWAGPFVTNERVQKGKGLLVDFSDVSVTGNRSQPVNRNYLLGKEK